MKKVLIATTALVMTAGVAAAESHIGVKVGGSARMGVVYNGSDAVFSSRIRIVFTASGETDGGLSFGGEVRNDQSGVGNTANGDSTVYIKGAFGKLTMGDTGNAADALVGQVSGVGYGPNDAIQEIAWVGRDNTGAYYEYSAGSLTFGVGAGQTEDDLIADANDDFVSVAAKYAAGNYKVAIGYEENSTVSGITASGSVTFGAATVKAKVADYDTIDTQWALSVDYVTGPATITAFYADRATDPNVSVITETVAGLGVAYDLGGGATLAAGVADNGTDTVADFGLKFAF